MRDEGRSTADDGTTSHLHSVRIGVYVCHCGTNIAGKVNVRAVAEYAGSLPGVVVSRDYKYMCADPGQELIKKDIRELGLNRVVVASCSPHLHEETFRRAVAEAGVNPYLVQMVSIREQVSWVTVDPDVATAKAMDLVRAGIKRVTLHEELEPVRYPVKPGVLVVGGGIAGIYAALTLANGGDHVYLVEREPSIGGHMAMFDKTFPTLDCSACILTPKMTAVKGEPNITLLTYSEVVEVGGYIGNFKVKVRRKPRYIIEDKCVGCYECIEACVYKEAKVSNEFDLGLGKRKPIYVPFPQAIPAVPVIDDETCIWFKSGKCPRGCIKACGDRDAIDLDQKAEILELEVGAIILATGFQTFDPRRLPLYGYGSYPNVYTALEVERLVNASGPTNGEIVMRDGARPKSVGIIHCIGSRDEKTNRWCSRVCCMYSLKLAHLVKERTQAEVFNFYIDMRTPGKGFEEFYDKLLEEGVHLIRGKVGEVTDVARIPEEEGKLVLTVEDTLLGMVRRIPVDMVILAVGLEPRHDAHAVSQLFNIGCSNAGWFTERHPKLAPVSTMSGGIFLAGACQGPKDIPDTVAQAGAAAAEALTFLSHPYIDAEPNTAYIDPALCSGCHICPGLCPYSAIHVDEQEKVAVLSGALCQGCGVCVAACPSGAAQQYLFRDEQLYAEIEGVLA
ncbi:MAG TPA: CoB--CoM heterodisulfide reductase iron-sulfur subunit A family protein [Chloroflexia bacterium]|nr:CoB--CoM heterodisulfide reductase iron-sulfur subunit A family protein [Chloroflexia bacterium]